MRCTVPSYGLSRSDNKLTGFYYSNIIFSPENKLWQIVDLKNRTLAYTNDSLDIPVGTYKWYFLDSYCNDPGQPWRTLNLHQAIEQPGTVQHRRPLSIFLSRALLLRRRKLYRLAESL